MGECAGAQVVSNYYNSKGILDQQSSSATNLDRCHLIPFRRIKTMGRRNKHPRASERFHLPLNVDALNYENIGFSLIWGTEIIVLITERSR